MEIMLIVFTLLMLIFTIMDMKFRAVPSVLLTASIFLLAFLRFENFQWAVIMGLFGLLLWEFSEAQQISFGIADIKILIMFGFFLNLQGIFAFLVAFSIGQVFYIFALRKWTNYGDDMPFIPMLFGLWIAFLITGVVA